ncbi:hypothetical protein CQY22_016500 [Mycolicibacterium brumae]|uniref:DUF8017 domain-containing protein n=1 Tax=Mycolicibacterium brumae TaxID=85968 RepID=A0A2G5P5C3_9MYCO|nr:hypothetical protein CQY22_016500 [Mycolicibacterium brumae]RWA20473.1 hypothetical protein MBRU_02115 [Mycolicibacterium brumae DSM 44177]
MVGYGPVGPPPKRPSRWPLWLAAVLVFALIMAGGAVAVVLGKGASPDLSGSDTATTTKGSVTAQPVQNTPSMTPSVEQPAEAEVAGCQGYLAEPGPATPAGWQTVTTKRELTYDVPADWNILSCDTMVGWQKECPDGPFGYCPIRAMTGASELPGQCADESLAVAGVPGSSDIDDIYQAANAEAAKVVDIFTTGGHVPTVSLSQPRPLTVGGRDAVQILATVSDVADQCDGPAGLHSVVATTVDGQQGTVLFIISMGQGVAGAPAPEVIDQMVATLRPSVPA